MRSPGRSGAREAEWSGHAHESDICVHGISVTSCSRPSTPGPGCRGCTPPRPGPASGPSGALRGAAHLAGRAAGGCERTAAASPGAPTRCATSCGRRRSRRASGSTPPARSRPRRRPAPPAVATRAPTSTTTPPGRPTATEHADDLAGLTPSEAMTSLVPVALAMWESGELVWVRCPGREADAVVLAAGPDRADDAGRGERLAAARAGRVGDVGRRALGVAGREQQGVDLGVDGDAEARRARPVVVAEPGHVVVPELAARAGTRQAVVLAGRGAVVAGGDDAVVDREDRADPSARALGPGGDGVGDAEEVVVPTGDGVSGVSGADGAHGSTDCPISPGL